jgi:DNA mismatch repair protein MutS
MPKSNKDKKLTPLMEQYLQIKDQYRDMILLYRMGDFYETFFDDAKVISRVLGIALTKRSHGKGGDAPLAGFPYHALDNYLPKLVQAGYKVAICEQVEDPKKAKVVVKREVVEVITPGTTVSEKILENKVNNYLCSIYVDEKNKTAGIAFIDVSTGEFNTTESELDQIYEIVISFHPKEILIAKGQEELVQDLLKGMDVIFTSEEDWIFSYQYAYDLMIQQFSVKNLKGFGLEQDEAAVSAAGAIIYYLQQNYKQKLSHIQSISRLHFSDYMILDESTRRNLELTASITGLGKKGTLIDIIDFTQTPMGGRLLKQWLNRPLINRNLIEERQRKVRYYYDHDDMAEEIRDILSEIYDLERMASRLATGRLNPRDLLFLKKSLQSVRQLEELFDHYDAPETIRPQFSDCQSIIDLIEKSIDENAPINIKDGNIIKAGYSNELDELKQLASEGKKWLVEFQARERERTGIPSLKVGYNKIFGYYIEVTKTHQHKVPETYVKKQTLVNADRYITEELKEYEDKILGAEEKIADLEYELFQEVRENISGQISFIIHNAKTIAELDVLVNFAYVAHKHHYVKPEFVDEPILHIKDGRHPVVEHFLPPGESFVKNDTRMSNDDCQIMIITGPNMAGKSTYLRQVGLLVLLAQVGSFVPAGEMKLGIVDRIFTRVGASDNIASGESTFMVEMIETANILNNATPRSLILLDEIGRGTSTFDGLSIAWAVAEYIHNTPQIAAKTLFATHYHELTELELLYPRIKNFNVAVKEVGDHVIFLRKIVPGGTDNSYGIHVASMAGLPQPVVERAREILANLESEELTPNKEPKIALRRTGRQVDKNQLTIFDILQESPVEKEIKNLDINNITPIEALNKLNELKKLIK